MLSRVLSRVKMRLGSACGWSASWCLLPLPQSACAGAPRMAGQKDITILLPSLRAPHVPTFVYVQQLSWTVCLRSPVLINFGPTSVIGTH